MYFLTGTMEILSSRQMCHYELTDINANAIDIHNNTRAQMTSYCHHQLWYVVEGSVLERWRHRCADICVVCLDAIFVRWRLGQIGRAAVLVCVSVSGTLWRSWSRHRWLTMPAPIMSASTFTAVQKQSLYYIKRLITLTEYFCILWIMYVSGYVM